MMIKEDLQKTKQPAVAIDHRSGERRKVPAQGFAYISVVGWICRRERCRRVGERLVYDQPALTYRQHLKSDDPVKTPR